MGTGGWPEALSAQRAPWIPQRGTLRGGQPPPWGHPTPLSSTPKEWRGAIRGGAHAEQPQGPVQRNAEPPGGQAQGAQRAPRVPLWGFVGHPRPKAVEFIASNDPPEGDPGGGSAPPWNYNRQGSPSGGSKAPFGRQGPPAIEGDHRGGVLSLYMQCSTKKGEHCI